MALNMAQFQIGKIRFAVTSEDRDIVSTAKRSAVNCIWARENGGKKFRDMFQSDEEASIQSAKNWEAYKHLVVDV